MKQMKQMNKTNLTQIALMLLAIVIFSACKKSPYPGYTESETGLYYKIIRGNSERALPQEGDVLTLEMSYYLQDNDSLLFSTKDYQDAFMLPVQKSLFNGDINEGLFMITEGDSASFIVKADSFLIYNVGVGAQLPPFVKPESMFRFEMKVIHHKTQAEYMAEMEARREQDMVLLQGLKEQETIDREQWLKDNNISTKPTQSGLIFIQQTAGTGAKVEQGDLVKAHYTGYFLNGQIFDSSAEAPEPFSFVAGRGQVIQGWDEAVMMMRKGGKARIILPSQIAYGESQPGFPIPPYSTLYFDLEIVDVEKTDKKVQ
jgi:FKBP-type peptidyl-prolyl cis-trans isomerase FkpA